MSPLLGKGDVAGAAARGLRCCQTGRVVLSADTNNPSPCAPRILLAHACLRSFRKAKIELVGLGEAKQAQPKHKFAAELAAAERLAGSRLRQLRRYGPGQARLLQTCITLQSTGPDCVLVDFPHLDLEAGATPAGNSMQRLAAGVRKLKHVSNKKRRSPSALAHRHCSLIHTSLLNTLVLDRPARRSPWEYFDLRDKHLADSAGNWTGAMRAFRAKLARCEVEGSLHALCWLSLVPDCSGTPPALPSPPLQGATRAQHKAYFERSIHEDRPEIWSARDSRPFSSHNLPHLSHVFSSASGHPAEHPAGHDVYSPRGHGRC